MVVFAGGQDKGSSEASSETINRILLRMLCLRCEEPRRVVESRCWNSLILAHEERPRGCSGKSRPLTPGPFPKICLADAAPISKVQIQRIAKFAPSIEAVAIFSSFFAIKSPVSNSATEITDQCTISGAQARHGRCDGTKSRMRYKDQVFRLKQRSRPGTIAQIRRPSSLSMDLLIDFEK